MQSLFAIFMGRSKLKHHKADSMTVAEEEQRVVSVITNLLTVFSSVLHRQELALSGCITVGVCSHHATQPTQYIRMLQNLGRGSRRDRVAAKFVESEFEKVDRLMEIYTVGPPAMWRVHCSLCLTHGANCGWQRLTCI